MPTMTLVDAAMEIAMTYHGGDRNKHDGELYLLHVARVARNIRDAGGTEVQQAIAWLHDTLEDTALTTAKLMTMLEFDYGFGYDIANTVVAGVHGMTKQKGESNEDYYHRCKLNGDSRFVKLNGDLKDNFRRNHNITDPEVKLRMAHKYSLGMHILS